MYLAPGFDYLLYGLLVMKYYSLSEVLNLSDHLLVEEWDWDLCNAAEVLFPIPFDQLFIFAICFIITCC